MTIKQHFEQLPEPYNCLALEDVEKFGIVTSTTFKKQSGATDYMMIYFMIMVKDSSKEDFYEAISDNLKALGK